VCHWHCRLWFSRVRRQKPLLLPITFPAWSNKGWSKTYSSPREFPLGAISIKTAGEVFASATVTNVCSEAREMGEKQLIKKVKNKLFLVNKILVMPQSYHNENSYIIASLNDRQVFIRLGMLPYSQGDSSLLSRH